jgi:hypothetical protein
MYNLVLRIKILYIFFAHHSDDIFHEPTGCIAVPASCTALTRARNTQHATRNTQHATCNTQHATGNTPHATRNTQHVTRNTQHATRTLIRYGRDQPTMAGVKHCRSHCHLAKCGGLMYGVKYSDVIGRKTHSFASLPSTPRYASFRLFFVKHIAVFHPVHQTQTTECRQTTVRATVVDPSQKT